MRRYLIGILPWHIKLPLDRPQHQTYIGIVRREWIMSYLERYDEFRSQAKNMTDTDILMMSIAMYDEMKDSDRAKFEAYTDELSDRGYDLEF
jgi:hypothetical protein